MAKQSNQSRAAARKKQFDALSDMRTGRGTSTDPVHNLRGRAKFYTPQQLRSFYDGNGFAARICATPARDATRKWFTLERVPEDLSRRIAVKMEELDFKNKLYELVLNSRICSNGAVLYFGLMDAAPTKDQPATAVQSLDFLNVIYADRFQPSRVSQDPLHPEFNKININVQGLAIHPSRYRWLVYSWDAEDLRGVSPLEHALDAIFAQDTALWSTNSMAREMMLKIWKSDLLAGLPPAKLLEVTASLKHMLDTQGFVALAKDEDFVKQTVSLSGMKDVFEFIFDNASATTGIPKNILLGKAHGVVTAGEYDTLNYAMHVSQMQEIELTPIVDRVVELILREFNMDPENIDWEVKWNSIWTLGPQEEMALQIAREQRDQLAIDNGKLTPEQARNMDERLIELQAQDPDYDELRRKTEELLSKVNG